MMAGAAVYAGYAVLANTIYGAATGESGGFVGELFGVQDKIDSQTAQAKQAAADKQAAYEASITQAAADRKAAADAAAQPKPAAPEPVAETPIAPPAPPTPPTQPPVEKPVIVPPVVEKPVVMPSRKDASLLAARKASIAQMRRRQGRASTILTGDSSDLLGG